MALSDDLRKRLVEAVVVDGLSRNAAAKLFKVSIASAVRWVKQFETTGDVSPRPCGGDRRSGRIEVHHDYLMGLIRRTPDITLLEIQERLIKNCGEQFSRARRRAATSGRAEAPPRMVRETARSRPCETCVHRRDRRLDQSGPKSRTLPARTTAARRSAARPLQDGHAGRGVVPSRSRGVESL